MNRKVAIIGMGNVGSTIAYTLLLKKSCDNLIVTCRNKKLLYAQISDLKHASVLINHNVSIEERSYSEFEDIDLIIFTAAAPLILGQNRLDMLETSKEIVKEVIPQIMASGFHGIIIVVTNPVDIVSYLIYKFSGLTNKKVIGTGTFLDTLRLKRERFEVFNVDVANISTYVVGEHGDSQVISWSNTIIEGDDIEKAAYKRGFQNVKDIERNIENKVKRAGWDIANFKGATTYGIANAVAEIVDCIFYNENKEYTLSTLDEGIYSSVPVILGRSGIQKKLMIKYSMYELEKLQKSKNIIRSVSDIE